MAYLWIFVPVYGWAKYAMISGLMSRLAFGELTKQPETVPEARGKVKSKLWSFLSAGLQVGIRLVLVYIAGAFLIAIVGALLMAVLPPMAIIAIILMVIAFVVLLIRLFSRWFVVEVPLAVESGINGTQSVERSWKLTEKSVGRVQIVVFIGFLVTFPLALLTGYLPSILILLLPPDSSFVGITNLLSLVLSLAGAILVMPFWQIIKAVVYYDLRSRQEGLDLELRNRRA